MSADTDKEPESPCYPEYILPHSDFGDRGCCGLFLPVLAALAARTYFSASARKSARGSGAGIRWKESAKAEHNRRAR